MNKKILLVDANLLLFKSFYGTIYNNLNNKDGVPTSAINAFFYTLLNVIDYIDPDCLYLAFDSAQKTKRHEMLADYKDGRKQAPEELWIQFDWIKKILTEMNIVFENIPTFEADDLIATLAKRFSENENEIIVFSEDKDLLQLVDDHVSVLNKRREEYTLKTRKNFYIYEEMDPRQVIDFKALAGDQSDNIKGVEGIGEKTAKKLLNKFSNIDNIYRRIEEVSDSLKEKLLADKENVYLYREIVKLNDQATTKHTIESTTFKFRRTKELANILEYLELKNLEKKIDNF
ncbi:5'-3' exonuclease [Mycoplasma sp. 480]|uniref:5'-3' exonuclease n=1 Tax=Mycoplasma sp. 480 TaxID=3440155 RepID=UPI003F512C94